MVYFFTLTGEVGGSVRVSTSRGRTEVCVKLRRLPLPGGAFRCFLTDGRRVRSFESANGCGVIDEMDVRAVAIVDCEGSISAMGSRNLNSRELEAFRTDIRLQTASLLERNEKRNPGAQSAAPRAETAGDPSRAETPGGTMGAKHNPGQTMRNPPPQSSAAAEILNMASYLFHGVQSPPVSAMGGERSSDGGRPPMEAGDAGTPFKASRGCGPSEPYAPPEEREAVENPFPQFFSNSYWQRKSGDTRRLTGTANVRGVKYSIVAIRSNAKYPPPGIGRSVRKLRSSDGKLYWVGMTKLNE